MVCRCPTEVLPRHGRKFRSLVGKVGFGPHEVPLRACKASLLSVGEDQGGDGSADIDLSSQPEADAFWTVSD